MRSLDTENLSIQELQQYLQYVEFILLFWVEDKDSCFLKKRNFGKHVIKQTFASTVLIF